MSNCLPHANIIYPLVFECVPNNEITVFGIEFCEKVIDFGRGVYRPRLVMRYIVVGLVFYIIYVINAIIDKLKENHWHTSYAWENCEIGMELCCKVRIRQQNSCFMHNIQMINLNAFAQRTFTIYTLCETSLPSVNYLLFLNCTIAVILKDYSLLTVLFTVYMTSSIKYIFTRLPVAKRTEAICECNGKMVNMFDVIYRNRLEAGRSL